MKKILFSISILIVLIAAGCAGQTVTAEPTEDLDAVVNTNVAQTVTTWAEENTSGDDVVPTEAVSTEVVAASATPLPTETVVPTDTPSVTETTAPTATTRPTSTRSSTVYYTATPQCYQASIVSETIPAGTVFSGGDGFVKKWTIKNTGKCDWDNDFTFALVSGSGFRGASELQFNQGKIEPGDTMTITIEMGAPKEAGHYVSVYRIYDGDGDPITAGDFWVEIYVD